MGTEVQLKSYLPGFYSMTDLNEDSNSFSCPLYYGDKTWINDQYYSSFFPKTAADSYPQHDKDRLKRKMLEHEAIFQNQVSELHRLYRIQRDLMDEVKSKESQKNPIPFEPALWSSFLASQVKTEAAHNWHIPNFGQPSISRVEDAHSPLSAKGSGIRDGPILSPNGVNSKDVEVLECRSTKARRKMFDLRLPGDKYIDIEEAEEFQDDTTSGTSSYIPIGNGKHVSRSNACLGGKNSLADLNEPVPIEETDGSAYSHFVGHEPSAKPKLELGLPKDFSSNSHHQSDNRSVNNMHVRNNEHSGGFFSHVFEAGHGKGNSTFVSQSFQTPKLSASYQQTHVLFDKVHDPPTFSLTEQSKADISRERMIHSLDVSRRNFEISSNRNLKSNMVSNVPSLSPFASSDPINLWSHSVSSSEKMFLNSSGPYSKSSVISLQANGNFGDKWLPSSNSRLNPGFGRELPNRNGFHYGSSSGSKELAMHFLSTSYDYSNSSTVGKGVFEQFSTHGSTKPYNCLNGADMKSESDVNLNVPLSNSLSDEPVSGLPWLRAKPTSKNEAVRAGMDLNVGELSFSQPSLQQSTKRDEIGNGFGRVFTQNLKPISSSTPQPSEGEAENKPRNRLFDINLPCDATVLDASQGIVAENSTIEEKADKKLSNFRPQIDLNSFADEDEASFTPNVPSTGMRMAGEIIDLEAPLVSEPYDAIHGQESSTKANELTFESAQSRDDCLQHEVMKSAAEAIVAISSSARYIHLDDANLDSSETSAVNPLNWFIETISSFGEALSRDKDGEIDYFESMVLELAETKEEDYMTKPLVPEIFEVEETGTTSALTARARKGQRRRGRQRRDFQRDILPGLVSLSRHEVTQDLQAFGGIMRATGHSWQSGLTRRSSGRGRRRSLTSSPPSAPAAATTPLMQQLNSIELGLDDRSLAGWGKTTRRPRRQRCPAGNLPSVALT